MNGNSGMATMTNRKPSNQSGAPSAPDYAKLKERLLAKTLDTAATGRVAMAVEHLANQIAVRRDRGNPWGPNNRAKCRILVVTGETHVGKTTALELALKGLGPIETPDGRQVQPDHLKIVASDSRKALVRELIRECVGMPLARDLSVLLSTERLAREIPVRRPSLVWIDEFSYALKPKIVGRKEAQEDEVTNVWNLVISWAEAREWPVPIIVSGLPAIVTSLNAAERGYVRERCDIVHLPPLQGKHATQVGKIIPIYCGMAELAFEVPKEFELSHRVLHAANHAFGTAVILAQWAVLEAYSRQQPLRPAHFADVYHRHSDCAPKHNPFIVERWFDTDTRKFLEGILKVAVPRKSEAF
jgi:hypothetical protein